MTEKSSEEFESEIERLEQELHREKMRNIFNRIFEYRLNQKHLRAPKKVSFGQEIFHQRICYDFDNATVEIEYMYDEPFGFGKMQFFRFDGNGNKVDIEDIVELEDDDCVLFDEMFNNHGFYLSNDW